MSDDLPLYILIFYIAVAIFTFGHAAANHPPIPLDPQEINSVAVYVFTILKSTVSAIAWPVYWSWELQT